MEPLCASYREAEQLAIFAGVRVRRERQAPARSHPQGDDSRRFHCLPKGSLPGVVIGLKLAPGRGRCEFLPIVEQQEMSEWVKEEVPHLHCDFRYPISGNRLAISACPFTANIRKVQQLRNRASQWSKPDK